MTEKLLHYTTALLLCCAPLNRVLSQCTIAIPSDAHVFDSAKTVITTGADNAHIVGTNWICTGDSIVITSGYGSQTFFLEENAVLLGGGGGSRTVYLKPGALFDAGGGGSQIITYDSASSYINCGSVYPTYCHPLLFDYTNAPVNGCNIASSVTDLSSKKKMKMFPNPADDFVWIDCTEGQNHNCFLRIYSSTAKEIIEERVNQFPFGLKTNSMAEGIYFVMLLDDDATLIKAKLIISR